jgi:hypothetical protein
MTAGRIAWIVVVTLVAISRASFAQEFQLWISKEDLFGANFPGEPVVTTITWTTEHGAQVPARVYTATRGPRTYSVTAVDYNQVKDILFAKAKDCPPGLERCNGLTSFSGEGYCKTDLRGAMIYAAFRIMKRPDVTVTHYMWNYLGGQAIESNELQFVNTKDQTRTHVTIYMHHNRLYIMEETVPANFPAPGLFVQSMSLREADGTEANHQRMYFNAPEVDPTETNEFYGRGRGAR